MNIGRGGDMYKTAIPRGLSMLTSEQIWAVDLDTLNMEDVWKCVLGQLYGEFSEGLGRLFTRGRRETPKKGERDWHWLVMQAQRHGFTVAIGRFRTTDAADAAFARLTQEWKQEIRAWREEHPDSLSESPRIKYSRRALLEQ
jgi:hypothetical protein